MENNEMNRDKFFGFDPDAKCVFVFLFENNDKKLSLFIEYSNDENSKLAKQELGLYGMFWSSENTVEEMITLFEINRSKKLGLKTWYVKN
jgi:hypothetical protein